MRPSKQTAQVFTVDALWQQFSLSLSRSCTDDVTDSFVFNRLELFSLNLSGFFFFFHSGASKTTLEFEISP